MIPHACLLLLASLAPATLQQPGDPPPGERGGGAGAPSWELINQVELIVNEDVLTRQQLLVQMRRELGRQPVTTQAEMAALEREITKNSVDYLLMVQRGRDLGFDPEQVQRFVSSNLELQAQGAGGIADLAEILAERGESAIDRKQTIEDSLYARSFEGAITGQAPGPGGRPIRDRYVRPGRLAEAHRQAAQDATAAELIGGSAETFVLQQLVIGLQHFGSAEEAREFTEDLRQRALAGEDFDELVATYSLAVEDERGLSRPMSLPELALISPAIADFCSTEPVGAISEVFPARERGRTVAYRVLRIHEHQAADLPPFELPQVQDRLRWLMSRNQDVILREEALERLFRSSYIWIAEQGRAPQRERERGSTPDAPDAEGDGEAAGAEDTPTGP